MTPEAGTDFECIVFHRSTGTRIHKATQAPAELVASAAACPVGARIDVGHVRLAERIGRTRPAEKQHLLPTTHPRLSSGHGGE